MNKLDDKNCIEMKREKEKELIAFMIGLYCKKQHGEYYKKTGNKMCPECTELYDYALERINKCPLMENKTFCSSCKIHCYKNEMREKIKKVMKFSGPRMIIYNPVLAINHIKDTLMNK